MKKLRFAKPKKIKKSTLKNKCDKLFGDIVRSRGFCELRGMDKVTCSGQLQTMHIIGRANKRLRWDTFNALCGCSGHHFWYTNHPTEFALFVEVNFPNKWKYVKEHFMEMNQESYEEILSRLSIIPSLSK